MRRMVPPVASSWPVAQVGEVSGPPWTIDVVGLAGEPFGGGARAALASATVLVGSARQLALVEGSHRESEPVVEVESAGRCEHIVMRGPLTSVFDQIEARVTAGDAVCVLASGDPGFFGIVAALGTRFGSERLIVHPAPSAVSLAFGLVGLPWDDAVVVSAHGRSLAEAVDLIVGAKVAVLTSPDNTPEVVGKALLDRYDGSPRIVVASNLGSPTATVVHTDLAGLATGSFNPMSVVLVLDPRGTDHRAPLAWGLPESAFAHRNGMITKSEVRSIALGKLALPHSGVLWDLGAGSGSVAIECARLRPGLRVIAVERHADDAARVEANAVAHGVAVEVCCGEAPDVLASLPDPDRVFVGGGGTEVLDAALARLRPQGIVVATFALMERAVHAQRRLGHLVQVSVSRGVDVGDLGLRLAAENPVFICWSDADPHVDADAGIGA
jgi:precorrin-6Y C5,15-methyltransferase (decarboxylating)